MSVQWLPEVRAVRRPDEDTAVIAMHVSGDIAHFAGHFPGFPILPGIVQLDWAVRFAEAHLSAFAQRGAFRALEQVKFQSLVLPGKDLELNLSWSRDRQRLAFAYAAGDRQCSSGRIAFEPAP
ncbi:3-hydroxyacyl-ACP dehydratase FabZ family protein [Paracidovorax avenae]|uniref:3-hydroxyacyl-ACP dehydratase FabZ family protein n=1 Tax=Paracidovorax avenae TaxID=80867 RepID=UPI001CEF5DDB|nr:hypothetical protein [Paracidovorax avenae]